MQAWFFLPLVSFYGRFHGHLVEMLELQLSSLGFRDSFIRETSSGTVKVNIIRLVGGIGNVAVG